MYTEAYLDIIKQRLERYYDALPSPAGVTLDYYAELHAADEGYFLMKSMKTYSVHYNEYVYVKAFDELVSEETLAPYLTYITQQMDVLETTTEHMKSTFTFVAICGRGVMPACVEACQRKKYHKDYCWTLKGWSDLAIQLVDLQGNKLHSNKFGEKNSKLWELE